MSVISLHVLHPFSQLIALKLSILVVLNALHLSFSLVSVSEFWTYMYAGSEMAQIAVPELSDTSDMTSFTEP